MKLSKLSLAAIVALGLGSSAFAADTLADAFKNGKVKGALQAYYFDEDSKNAAGVSSDGSILDLGADLSFTTDSYKGFTAGLTYQAVGAPDADKDGKAKFNGDMYGSGGVLSEAYVAYSMNNTTVKAGRQYISTPLVAGSGSRITKESFQGVLVLNTDVPNTTLGAAWVNKMSKRTDGAGNIGQFTNDFVNGGVIDSAWTILAINKSIPNLTLTAQYAEVIDASAGAGDVTVIYGQGDYAIPTDFANFTLSAQYGASDGIAGSEGNSFGGMLDMSMDNGLSAAVAYNSNSDEDIVNGLGNGADWAFASANFEGGNYDADVDTTMVKVDYDFSKVGAAGLSAGVKFTNYDDGKAVDNDFWDVEASYAFAGELKGLGIAVQYEDCDDTDYNELRVKLNYNF